VTDKHYTTPELAAAIIEKLVHYGDLYGTAKVLDPCVGLGAFSDAVLSRFQGTVPEVTTVDIDEDVIADIHGDFLSTQFEGKFDLIVSNVPFSLTSEFIERAVELCEPTGCIAFLMLLQFLGSSSRKELFDRYPVASVDVIRPRPSFAADGSTDAREYALFRFRPEEFNIKRGSIGFIDCPRPKRQRTPTKTKTKAEAAE
jgi:hypothetical protein